MAVEVVPYYRYLGVLVDKRLDWKENTHFYKGPVLFFGQQQVTLVLALFHYTVLALLGSTRLGTVPEMTFSITIVSTQRGQGHHSTAPRNCCDFVLYAT